jgi:hypothetical protein
MKRLSSSRKNCLVLLQFALLFFVSNSLFAQLSDLHYLPPLKQQVNSPVIDRGIDAQAIYFSTPVTASFTVNVYKGTGTTPWKTFQLSKTTPYILNAPDIPNSDNNITFVDNANTGEVLSNSGLRIQSANGEKFYVNFRGASVNQGSSLVSKGRAALGKKFRWGGAPVKFGNNTNATLGMMASEDGTTIQISGYDPSIVFRKGANYAGYTADNLTITLNKGQSFVLEYPIYSLASPNVPWSTNTLYDGWLGAAIVSDKDIVVSLGNVMYSSFITGLPGDRDAAFDQIIPENVLGSEYVFVRGYGSNDFEFPIIIATQNGTEIYLNDALTPAATIDAGEYYHVSGSNYSGTGTTRPGENLYVRTSKQVYAYQTTAGANSAKNVDYNFIAPVNFLLEKSVDFIPKIQEVGNNVEKSTGGTTNITITGGISVISAATTHSSDLIVYSNGSQVSPSTVAAARKTISGTSQWVSYFLENLTGNVSVTSTGSIAVGYTGQSGAMGVSGYFSGFSSVPSIDVNVALVGGCLQTGNVTLTAPSGYAIYQWYREGQPISGATQRTFTPTLPGSYTVGITTSGAGQEYVSAPVDVSDCNPEIKLDVTSAKKSLAVG